MVTTEESSGLTEEQKVDKWRFDEFDKLLPGFDAEIIMELVNNHDISSHDLENLLENGCDPHLAVKILI